MQQWEGQDKIHKWPKFLDRNGNWIITTISYDICNDVLDFPVPRNASCFARDKTHMGHPVMSYQVKYPLIDYC